MLKQWSEAEVSKSAKSKEKNNKILTTTNTDGIIDDHFANGT